MEIIASRSNLVDRSIDVLYVLFSSYLSHVEDCNHMFVSCEVVDQLWRKVIKWIDLSFPLFHNVLDVLT